MSIQTSNTILLNIESERDGDFVIGVTTSNGKRIGRVAISFWESQPMLYLHQIELDKECRRLGYGSATIAALSNMFKRTIIPVQQTGGSFGFWEKMRSRSGSAFNVDDEISTTEWSLIVKETENKTS